MSTIDGNLKTIGAVNITSRNTYARFELVNYGANIPRVSGAVIGAPLVDFRPDANGAIAGTVYGNDVITPAGTFYRVTIFDDGVMFRCYDFEITGGAFDLNSAAPITTVPVVTPPTGDTTYLRLDGGNNLASPLPITEGGTGQVTAAAALAALSSVEDTRTNITKVVSTLKATTTGTPAAGIGTAQKFQAESGDETPSDFGQIEFAAASVSPGSEETYFQVLLRIAGLALSTAYRFAATFTGKAIFTHANTADRTYTLPNISGTIAVGLARGMAVTIADGTTASPSYNNVGTPVTIVTQGGPVLVLASFGAHAGVADLALFALKVDAGADSAALAATSSVDVVTLGFARLITGLAAGSHTFQLRFKAVNSIGAFYDGLTVSSHITAIEQAV